MGDKHETPTLRASCVMSDVSTSKLHEARSLCDQISHVMSGEDWESIETLLAERNQCLEIALTPPIGEDLLPLAQSTLDLARRQDETLKHKAKERRASLKEELLNNKRNEKSLDAYKKW